MVLWGGVVCAVEAERWEAWAAGWKEGFIVAQRGGEMGSQGGAM